MDYEKPTIRLEEIDLNLPMSGNYGGNLIDYPFYSDYIILNHPDYKRGVKISISTWGFMHYYVKCKFDMIPFIGKKIGQDKYTRICTWDHPKMYDNFHLDDSMLLSSQNNGYNLWDNIYDYNLWDNIYDNDEHKEVLSKCIKENIKTFDFNYDEKKIRGILAIERANEFVQYLLDEVLIIDNLRISLDLDV